jgi:hypothetical protein
MIINGIETRKAIWAMVSKICNKKETKLPNERYNSSKGVVCPSLRGSRIPGKAHEYRRTSKISRKNSSNGDAVYGSGVELGSRLKRRIRDIAELTLASRWLCNDGPENGFSATIRRGDNAIGLNVVAKSFKCAGKVHHLRLSCDKLLLGFTRPLNVTKRSDIQAFAKKYIKYTT